MATTSARPRINFHLKGLSSKQKDISPNFVSTDLFTPTAKKRITIPLVAKQPIPHLPPSGKSWGENDTEYGGIGKLPFLGKNRESQIFVSRNHKHYISFLSKYENVVQPQTRGNKYSDCRVNDQILPDCLKAPLDPAACHFGRGPPPRNPYFSHKPVFEIFPWNDPQNKTHKEARMLSTRTRNALREYYHNLYDISRYSTIYKDLSDHIASARRPQSSKTCPTQSSTKGGTTVGEVKLRENLDLGEATNIKGKAAEARDIWDSNRHEDRDKHIKEFNENLKLYLTSHHDDIKLHTLRDAELVMILLDSLDKYDFGKLYGILKRVKSSSRIGKAERDNEELLISDELYNKLLDCLGVLEQFNLSLNQREEMIRSILKDRSSKPAPNVNRPYSSRGLLKPINKVISTYGEDDHMNSNACASKSTIRAKSGRRWPPGRCYILERQRMKMKGLETYIKEFKNSYDGDEPKLRSVHPRPLSSTKTLRPMSSTSSSRPRSSTKNCRPLSSTKMPRPLSSIKTLRPLSSTKKQRTVRFCDSIPTEIDAATPPSIVNNSDITQPPPLPKYDPGYTHYVNALNQLLPEKIDDGLSKPYNNVLATQLYKPEPFDPMRDVEHGLDHHGRPVLLPPVPLAAALTPTGNRVQDRLGLNFKVEAQRRYHATYPDTTPDLRDNQKSGKQQYFSGYHASVFR